MKKSKLASNPRRLAGKRLRKKFNHFPGDSSSGRYVAVTRFPSPEAARLALAMNEGTSVGGWFEVNNELMAIYRNCDAMILFDRYLDPEGSLDTVVSIVAATQGEVDRVMGILNPPSSDDWEELLLEFGDD